MREGLPYDAVVARRQALAERLASHPLYDALQSLADLRVFMEHHVFAVWDFVSLIKAVQAKIAPSRYPWVPPDNPRLVRFINQLVLEEESDIALGSEPGYAYCSHFTSYCSAMREIGADTHTIEQFVARIRRSSLEDALQIPGVPPPSAAFVRFTFQSLRRGRPYELAAILAYGRESLVPTLFQSIMQSIRIGPGTAPTLHRYLRRHIDLDGAEHSTLAGEIVETLCAHDPRHRHDAMSAAVGALQARLAFWDGIHFYLTTRHRDGAPIVAAGGTGRP